MKLITAMFLGLCCTLEVFAQANLVPNPSFEYYEDCPSIGGRIWLASPWVNVRGSCDYFHECGINGFGVPFGAMGGGGARTGQAHIGIGITIVSQFDAGLREFAGVPLSSPLIAGKEYWVGFHVRMADSVWYAGKDLSALVSIGQPPDDFEALTASTPQVNYAGYFLTDKEEWVRIEGVFTAQGGEDFLTIGNFKHSSITETLFVEGGGVPRPLAPGFWKSVYYFIDDVSVIPVDSLVGIEGQLSVGNNRLSINPNPASEYFIIETAQGSGTLVLYDAVGKEVLSMALHSSRQRVNVGGFPAGVYVAVVEREGVVVGRRKVVVE
jgi:hypothetical protein